MSQGDDKSRVSIWVAAIIFIAVNQIKRNLIRTLLRHRASFLVETNSHSQLPMALLSSCPPLTWNEERWTQCMKSALKQYFLQNKEKRKWM